MKIAFVGKGGSGKTTLSALLARSLAARNFPVVAIDADINQHLAETLGMSTDEARSVPPLGIEINTLKEYLRGSNPLIPDARAMIKTTPPGPGSRLISMTERNPVFDHFVRTIDGISFMAAGPIDESDVGVRCYHSKTGAVELLLNHLIDREREYIIVDMTAGADAFASGLFTRFDVVFCIVEPTAKSVGVYEQYLDHARAYQVNIKVIGNKMDAPEDREYLAKKIGSPLIASFFTSDFVKTGEKEKGDRKPMTEIEPGHAAELGKISAYIDSLKKDWKKFYRQAAEFHIQNALSWGNADVGMSIEKQADLDSPFVPDVVST